MESRIRGYYLPKRQMPPATPAKTQVTELQFTPTNRPLLQPPLRNTDFIRSSLDLSFLSFNSGGGESRATNKIRPANAPTAVPDFGGIKKRDFLQHGMNMGTCRAAVADAR